MRTFSIGMEIAVRNVGMLLVNVGDLTGQMVVKEKVAGAKVVTFW